MSYERLKLHSLTAEQLAPLESVMNPAWPEVWRDLAISHYLTLMCHPLAAVLDTQARAQLSVELAAGVGKDLGGTQPYIPNGLMNSAKEKFARVVNALKSGKSYKDVADEEGISSSRVRQIEKQAIERRRSEHRS